MDSSFSIPAIQLSVSVSVSVTATELNSIDGTEAALQPAMPDSSEILLKWVEGSVHKHIRVYTYMLVCVYGKRK